MKNQRIITVLPYNPEWPHLFQNEKNLLKNVLGEQAITIEHIGSTSVVGFSAKPIIDILIEVKNLHAVDALNEALALVGYKAKGENGIEGRRYFQKGGLERTHHLHIFEPEHEHAYHHRVFRDLLRSDPDIAEQYSEIKLNAVKQCDNNMQTYMALKNDFIETQLVRAKHKLKKG